MYNLYKYQTNSILVKYIALLLISTSLLAQKFKITLLEIPSY